MGRRTLSLVALLILAFLVNACGMSGKPSVDEAVAHLREAQKQQTRIHAVVEVRPGVSGNESQSNSERIVIEEWVGGPRKIRMEYKDAPDYLKGEVVVANGDEVWRYEPKGNQYSRIRMTDISFGPFSPKLTRGMVGYALKECNFERVSKDTMAGREAFRLEAVPKEKGAESPFLDLPSGVTFWMDAKTWNVLGWELRTPHGKMCMCTKSVEFDPHFPKGTFEFHPPAGSRELDVPNPVPIDPKEADEAVGFHVLRPSYLPKDVELITADAIPPGGDQESSIFLEYGIGGLSNFVISETKLPEGADEEGLLSSGAGVERVKVHGRDARLMPSDDKRATWLQWIEGGLQISITGPLKKEAILKVAESME